MKLTTCFRPFHYFAALFLVLGASSHGRAQSSGSATIEGRVFNSATNEAVRSARVSIEGSPRSTLTDDTGSYRLGDVPAGPLNVTVTYFGFDPKTVHLIANAGTVSNQEFVLTPGGSQRDGGQGVVALDAFTVVAGRQLSDQAIALNERREAPNIKNVVAFNEYSDRSGEDIGEFMRFLPGVSIDDGGQVASTISLRGFPANYSSLALNGIDVASARGNSRAQSLLDIPLVNISRVDVTKEPTPEMPASGLGGSVNIISKTGFETSKPFVSYRLYQISDSYSPFTINGGPRGITDKLSPSYQHPSGDFDLNIPISRTLAITTGFADSWRLKPMERGNHTDTQADWNYIGGFQRVSTWNSLDNILKTWNGQLGATWRPTSKDVVTVNAQRRYVSNNIVRDTIAFTYGAGATGDRSFTQGAATAVGSVVQGSGANQETGDYTDHLTLNFTHRENFWRVDGAVGYSQSISFLNDINNGHFNAAPATLSGLILRGDGLGLDDGVIPTRYTATKAGAPINVFDSSQYVLGNPTSTQNNINSAKRTARLDYTMDFNTSLPTSFKTGIFGEKLSRDQRAYNQTWTFTPNGSTAAADKLAGNFDVFDRAFDDSAPHVYSQQINWVSPVKYYQLLQKHPDWFPLNQPLYYQNLATNSRKLDETVEAAYVRGDIHLLKNRLWVMAGVRFENTKDSGQGLLDNPSNLYVKNAQGSVVLTNGAPTLVTTDPTAQAKLRYVERGLHASQSYHDFYPSVNLTYNLTDKILLRGAYAKTIGRPDLNLIIPGSSLPDPTASGTPTITVNNTGLKPWTADNFDLSLETYQVKGGFGSVGVFQKNVKDFFGSVTTQATPALLAQYGLPNDSSYLNDNITTLTNAGDAKIKGFEYGYTQSLLFLPDWARGVQLFANGTILSLDGSNVADFSGYAPRKFSGGVNFVRRKFYIKVNFTYQSETKNTLVAASTANGIPANTYDYQAARLRIGVSAQYSISKQLALFGSATDANKLGFLATADRFAPDTPDYERARRRQELGATIIIGVKGQF